MALRVAMYVLRMRVMTSTVGGNLTNRPPALRHIHVKIVGLLLGRDVSQQGDNVESSSQLSSFSCFIYKMVSLEKRLDNWIRG
jgi:hypothetical protein